MGLLAGDAEKGGERRKDAKSREHLAGRAEGLFSAPGFVAQFFWLCPGPAEASKSPPLPQSLLQEQRLLGSPRLPSTVLGTGSTPIEEVALQLPWGLLDTSWSQTQEGAQHISGELSITLGRTALTLRCLKLPGCQGPVQRAASGAALQHSAHMGWGSF